MAKAAVKAAPKPARAPSVVGWHGIYLEAPPDWDLGAVAGDMAQGHLRVDGPGDLHARVKWRREKKKVDIERILERYLKSLERTYRGHPEGFRRNSEVRLPIQTDVNVRKPVFFAYQTPAQPARRGKPAQPSAHALGLIWHCSLCGRITIAQVDGPTGRNLTPLTVQILGSLDDHAVQGCHTWGVYGLQAEIPADYQLTKSQLLSGYIRLEFAKGSSIIILDRWGLADVVLRGTTLKEWLKRRYAKAWKRFRYQMEDAEVRDHQGVAILGRVSGIRDRARAAALSVMRVGAVTELSQFAWHCEETNRVCSVLVQHSKADSGLAEEIAASYVCHV